MQRDLRHVLGRIDLYRDFAPGSIQVLVRGSVRNRVMISEVMSDVLHQFFHFIKSFREERLAACDFGELQQIVLGFL